MNKILTDFWGKFGVENHKVFEPVFALKKDGDLPSFWFRLGLGENGYCRQNSSSCSLNRASLMLSCMLPPVIRSEAEGSVK